MPKYPLYLNIPKKEWEERIKKGIEMLNPCIICPRHCKVNRLNRESSEYGFCRVKDRAIISSFHSHFGEEPCLVGKGGSGTIFFSSCNLACVYCQNYEISQLREGREVTTKRLALIMLNLQNQNCININLVSPTIYLPQILKALKVAVFSGLKLPIVYNTGGYDSVKSLKLLDGIVDIYMPDMKYSDDKIALKYSHVPNYWKVVRKAIKEMHRQTGDLLIENGIAKKGLLVRHLVLPHRLSGTEKIMKYLSKKISPQTYVNLMDQYYPAFHAFKYPKLSRKITKEEFHQAKRVAKEAGISRIDS